MEWMNDDVEIFPGRLMPSETHSSWIDSRTGGYRIGSVCVLPTATRSTPTVVAQDWHSREVRVLSQEEAATLRLYPAEPIPEPES